ncbi:MAG: sulfite exporter TauE/SafE family protein [Gammaproteobacteria bacterium]|nr:sulfite exporter TauE/SafE family protein [Gammaproteobacteria bacterium]MBQ0838149.1 sulfite exporter TauE/SafE family protein [Gammaproteobacteria bacterium]
MIEGLPPVLAAIVAMFGIGLLGAGHCFAMCGGIASALGFASEKGSSRYIVAYNLGRVLSYACAGGAVASLGYASANYLALAPLLRGIAGLLLIAMGLTMAGWWRGLSYLERAGSVLWRRLQPLGQRLLPVRSVRSAILLGLVWGWLPCGLVYTALAYAATAQTPLLGMAQMAAFGCGTLPAVLLGGLSLGRLGELLRSHNFRLVFALLLMAYGLWTLLPVVLSYHRH